MSLNQEIKKFKKLVRALNKLNENMVKCEDILPILELLKEFIPLLIRTIKTR